MNKYIIPLVLCLIAVVACVPDGPHEAPYRPPTAVPAAARAPVATPHYVAPAAHKLPVIGPPPNQRLKRSNAPGAATRQAQPRAPAQPARR